MVRYLRQFWLHVSECGRLTAKLASRSGFIDSDETLHHEVPLQTYLLLHQVLDFAKVLLHIAHLDAAVDLSLLLEHGSTS